MASFQDHEFCNLTTVSSRPLRPFSLLEDTVSCPLFPVLIRTPTAPPIVSIVFRVPPDKSSGKWGDSETIHGTRMVFILLTAMQSDPLCVALFVDEPGNEWKIRESWRARERESDGDVN